MNTLTKVTATTVFNRLMALMGLTPKTDTPTPESTGLQVALKHADEEIKYFTDVDELVHACLQAMYAITAELAILRRQGASLSTEFTRDYMAWMRVRVTNLTPHIILADLAKARRFKQGGGAATVLEILLATSILLGFAVGLLPAFVSSAGLTILFLLLAHGAITGATDKPSLLARRDLVYHQVFLPALRLVVPSVGIALLARTISGLSEGFLDFLLPLLQLVMGVATLGLILLSGALFALADIYAWSQRYAQAYDQIERRLAELETRREYYRAVSRQRAGLEGLPDEHQTPKPTSSLLPRASLGMLLILSGFLTGCDSVANQQKAKRATPLERSRPASFGGDINVRIDRSGSVQREAAAATARNLYNQLPELIKAMRARCLTVGYFTDQSWSIPIDRSLALPQWQQPSAATIQQFAQELILLQGIKQDVEAKNKAAREAAQEAAAKQYEADLQKVLAEISPATFNPAVSQATRCTDLYGILARLSKGPQSGKHLYVIVSDGYHTCGPMKPLAAPSGEVTVLLLLTTANAKESAGQRADEQYLNREAALLQIAPWLKIVPGDQDNLAALLQAPDSGKPAAINPGQ